MPTMNQEATNLPEAWHKFQQHAELMFSGPLKRKGEDEKCSYLHLCVGEKGCDIFNTWSLQSRPLFGYGGEHLAVKGKCDLKCKHKDIEVAMTFYVVDTNAPPVIGLKGCIDFGLIKQG